jgi:hypothetical protein
MGATAWLEPISAVVRVGAKGSKHFDAYHFAATVRYLAVDEIEIVGVAKNGDEPGIRKSDWVAMTECFRASGIRRVLFKRVKNGIVRKKWLDLTEREQ